MNPQAHLQTTQIIRSMLNVVRSAKCSFGLLKSESDRPREDPDAISPYSAKTQSLEEQREAAKEHEEGQKNCWNY